MTVKGRGHAVEPHEQGSGDPRGMTGQTWERVPIDAQSIAAPLSSSAVFLVVEVEAGEAALAKVRGQLAAIEDLIKTVGFRDLSGRLSCIVGIGHNL